MHPHGLKPSLAAAKGTIVIVVLFVRSFCRKKCEISLLATKQRLPDESSRYDHDSHTVCVSRFYVARPPWFYSIVAV